MSVSSEVALVDKAAHYVTNRQLITSVGVPEEWRTQLTQHAAEMLLVYSESLQDIGDWVLADLLVWTEERVAQQVGKRTGREFWQRRDGAWEAISNRSKRGLSNGTLHNYKVTAARWPWSRRQHTDIIGFQHHLVLAALEPEEQDYWLDLASSGEWTAVQLRAKLYEGLATEPVCLPAESEVVRICQGAGIALSRKSHASVELFTDDAVVRFTATIRNNKPRLEIEHVDQERTD